MPHGLNIATCLHCGKQWVVGDCIPSTCDECSAAGHEGFCAMDCPACNRDRAGRMRLAVEAAAEAERRREGRRREGGFRVLFDSARPRS